MHAKWNLPRAPCILLIWIIRILFWYIKCVQCDSLYEWIGWCRQHLSALRNAYSYMINDLVSRTPGPSKKPLKENFNRTVHVVAHGEFMTANQFKLQRMAALAKNNCIYWLTYDLFELVRIDFGICPGVWKDQCVRGFSIAQATGYRMICVAG